MWEMKVALLLTLLIAFGSCGDCTGNADEKGSYYGSVEISTAEDGNCQRNEDLTEDCIPKYDVLFVLGYDGTIRREIRMHFSNEIVSSLQVSVKKMVREARGVKRSAHARDGQRLGIGGPTLQFTRSTKHNSRKQRRKEDNSQYSQSIPVPTHIENFSEKVYNYAKTVVKTINLVLQWKSVLRTAYTAVLLFLA